MAQNPMVAEVNRLIANLLAAGEQIAFPEVGTLKPVTQPAQKVARRKIVPPLHEIDFSSELQGQTLAQRLIVAAGCTKEQADDIYARWLAQTWQEGVLTLEGIGTLRQKHFTLDPDFDRRINPQGRTPIAVRRRRYGFDWMIALGAVAIVAALVIGWYGYKQLNGSVRMPWERTQQEVATTSPAPSSTDTLTTQAAPEVTETPAPIETPIPMTAPTAASTSDPVAERMISGNYYVVLGVFSTPENAARAVREAAAKSSAAACLIYHFGQKWMVSPYTSADQAAANAFRREQAAVFPEMWIYRAR